MTDKKFIYTKKLLVLDALGENMLNKNRTPLVKFPPDEMETLIKTFTPEKIATFLDVTDLKSDTEGSKIKKMVQSLRGYKLIQGARGKEGVNEEKFIDIIQHVSALVEAAPEIIEMDINPLNGTQKEIIAVDVRIHIQK